MFVIRYYTWPDYMSKPNIVRGSDDWCFMRRDGSYIGSTTLQNVRYTSSYYPRHTDISMSETWYVNEWEPAHYYINNGSVSDVLKKSPFSFKLISPATFNDYSGTSNYHYISVNFNGVYTHPTLDQRNLDLYYYTPVCYLNGFSIHRCTISGNVIKMEFQQPIANG